MTNSTRDSSILDLMGMGGRRDLGIGEQPLGLSLFFHRKDEHILYVDFNELPFMGRSSREIFHQLIEGVGIAPISEGLTKIFVDSKGETQVLVNDRPRNDDPFGRAVLQRHLCSGFDITSRIERLKEELNEVRGTPLWVHELKCQEILERFLVSSREAHRTVTSIDEVLFTFRCPERERNLPLVDEEKPYLVVPFPLAHRSASYDFLVTWTCVLGSGYRRIMSHHFFAMAQRVFGRNAGIVPQTFRLPSTRSFEQ